MLCTTVDEWVVPPKRVAYWYHREIIACDAKIMIIIMTIIIILIIYRLSIAWIDYKRSIQSIAWIDYKKAFDSIPHDWIIKGTEMYKVALEIINFVKVSTKTWKTTLILNHVNGSIISNSISINRGIFQGDSFSPLLFCIALFPLSRLL